MRRLILITILLLPLFATGESVYEAKDGRSKVYSDRPLPGSKPLALPPPNVIERQQPLPAAKAVEAKSVQSREAAPVYRSLAVVFPEAGGSVAANQATFEIRVAVDPPLRVDRGDAFVLRLDGRPVPGRYTVTEMMIPPEFFEGVAPAGVQRHVVEASVVDGAGNVLLTAPAVEFQSRFVNKLQRPRHEVPQYVLPPTSIRGIHEPGRQSRDLERNGRGRPKSAEE